MPIAIPTMAPVLILLEEEDCKEGCTLEVASEVPALVAALIEDVAELNDDTFEGIAVLDFDMAHSLPFESSFLIFDFQFSILNEALEAFGKHIAQCVITRELGLVADTITFPQVFNGYDRRRHLKKC